MAHSLRRFYVSNSGLRPRPFFKTLKDSVDFCLRRCLATGQGLGVVDVELGEKVVRVSPAGKGAVDVSYLLERTSVRITVGGAPGSDS